MVKKTLKCLKKKCCNCFAFRSSDILAKLAYIFSLFRLWMTFLPFLCFLHAHVTDDVLLSTVFYV